MFTSLSSGNPFCECLVYFALTREKFVFSCVAVCESLGFYEEKGGKEASGFAEFVKIWEDDVDMSEKNKFTKRDPNLIKRGGDNEYNKWVVCFFLCSWCLLVWVCVFCVFLEDLLIFLSSIFILSINLCYTWGFLDCSDLRLFYSRLFDSIHL